MSNNLVKNIWAVGRNYAEHAKEMSAEITQQPLIFLKSGSCLETNSKIQLPNWSNDVHHEIELAFWVDENLNLGHVSLALDLTARDAQTTAKKNGHPWTLSKSFKAACPIGRWISLKDIQNLESLSFKLSKNKNIVQSGHFQEMIFKPLNLLDYVKNFYPIEAHDIILTGTPAGVAKIQSGDLLEATLQSENREILACHWDVI